MHCENAILIHGPAERVYELASDIASWPRILPHYRYVIIDEDSGRVRLARMGARRGWFPVTWRARQELLPDERRILFRHVGGITRGMEVEWRVVQEGASVRVTIAHELDYPLVTTNFPLGPVMAVGIGKWLVEMVIGRMFVQNIAGKTLTCIKGIVEAGIQATDGSS